MRGRCWALMMPCLAIWLCLGPASASGDESVYPLVLQGGRVIDPESGLDAIRDVAFRDGRIAAISEKPLSAEDVIDVSELVVSPGFIDLHTHSPTPLGQTYQVQDGVTTALELEAGAYPVERYGTQIADRPLMNFGSSVGYGSIRVRVKLGIEANIVGKFRPVSLRGYWTAFRSLFSLPREAFTERASSKEREAMRRLLQQGLDDGGLGIGLPLDYLSEGVDADELKMVFDVAAARRVPVFVHLRRGVNGDPAGLNEVLSLARRTEASLHVCHLSHNAMRNTQLFLDSIRRAREEGLDVTTELLPYNAGSAAISSAVFDRDWRTIFAIDYSDVQWAATGERFTEATWQEYREKHPDGQVIHHYLEEEWTRAALVDPDVIVVSDLLPMYSKESKVAPHNGAFAKVLGRYVRETGLLDLPTALAKMTILPARRLEDMAPRFRYKGRLQVGADADVTVFDPDRIIDRATYADPYQASEGVEYVFVGGTAVVRAGALQSGVEPGERLTTPAD